MQKRVEELEERVCPPHDGAYTLEELCRQMWRLDKKRYLEKANEGGCALRFFIQQFEREDTERLTLGSAKETAAQRTTESSLRCSADVEPVPAGRSGVRLGCETRPM